MMIRIVLLCRSCTAVDTYFVYGCPYNTWSFVTYLCRCLHNWRMWRGIFPRMGARVILGLALLMLRRSRSSLQSSQFCYFSFLLFLAMCFLIVQRPGVSFPLDTLSNKIAPIGKKQIKFYTYVQFEELISQASFS